MIYCSCPDERHPEPETKAKSKGAKRGCLAPPEDTLMGSRKETIFSSSISLLLLCFKGMKCFQSQISKTNSIYSSLKNSMLTFNSCGKEIIKASKYFWHMEIPSMPCYSWSTVLLELAGLQMAIQEVRAKICKSKYYFATDMTLFTEWFVIPNSEQWIGIYFSMI